MTIREGTEKAGLTVKAVDTERAYGEANPIFELKYTGFKNNETKDVLLAEPIEPISQSLDFWSNFWGSVQEIHHFILLAQKDIVIERLIHRGEEK